MNTEINQGTVIYGIRSSKYPTTPCYGIIITARCDIAQCKVPKYYFLVAVDASKWFLTETGYNCAFSSHINNFKKDISDVAKELGLDGEVLLTRNSEETELILQDTSVNFNGDKEKSKKLKNLKKSILKFKKMSTSCKEHDSFYTTIKENEKIAINCLKDIDAGKKHHFYYLPQLAYLKEGTLKKGLIIDLLEIGELSLEDAKKLTSPFSSGIYFKDLPEIPNVEDLGYIKRKRETKKTLNNFLEYIRLKKAYWLDNDSDFVAIEGTIKSPWCEHLMQRFSNAFVRIGIDNPSEEDYQSIIKNICEE